MDYKSEIVFKTTEEGFRVFKEFNDSITDASARPLSDMNISRTKSGFVKITHDDIEWSGAYLRRVLNFKRGIRTLETAGIPYKFIRIGEDYDDIEIQENYTHDMPEQIENMFVVHRVYDPDDPKTYEDYYKDTHEPFSEQEADNNIDMLDVLLGKADYSDNK